MQQHFYLLIADSVEHKSLNQQQQCDFCEVFFFLQCKQIGPNNESMSLRVPSRGGNAEWARAYMTHTHQGQMLIQERASGTVTAHHWKLRICRRTLHTVCLLFIYLAVCAGVWGVMSCAVVGECCISLIPRHTLQIQIPLMCYSSHNPPNFTMNFELQSR